MGVVHHLNAEPIDPVNRCCVSVCNERIVMILPPRESMSKREALVLAAWLVALADENGEFERCLAAVLAT